jgi:recombination protein RecA
MASELQKERTKALELAIAQIEKQHGKGAIMKLGDESAKVRIEAIPTGSLGLDLALGVGGAPRGRVVEIFGPESSGKTTLTLSVIANAQRLGGHAVFIDAEHALDASYAQRIGVDIDNLHVAQPGTGEEALEIAETLVRSGAVDIVAIDSVAALVPKAEIEGEMGDSHMGLQARLMSQALRKLTAAISKSRTCVIFINQIRMQIGVLFGNPETTTGGKALKFYSSVRLDIRRVGSIKEGEEVVGSRVRVKVVKNKVAAPFKQAEFDIMYDTGISHEGEIIDLGVEKDLIKKSGTWFSYGEERLGQGRENARLFLVEHRDIAMAIEAELRRRAMEAAAAMAAAAEARHLPANGTAEAASPPASRESEAEREIAAPEGRAKEAIRANGGDGRKAMALVGAPGGGGSRSDGRAAGRPAADGRGRPGPGNRRPRP